MDLYEEFGALVDALEGHGIDYAICGGVALAIHGHPRFTKDIALVVQKATLDAIRSCVRGLGFVHPASVLPFGKGTDQERNVYRFTKVSGEDALTIDLLILGPSMDDVWESRERFEWAGRNVRVVSREGLIRMKKLADRSQDRADIECLEGRAGVGDGNEA